MSFIVGLTLLLIAIVLWFSFKFGRYIENGPPGTKRAAVNAFLRKHKKLYPFLSIAICLYAFREDIGPFFSKLVSAKATQADILELHSAVETHRPRAVAAIHQGTRQCMRRDPQAEVPDFVGQMMSEFTVVTFDAVFAVKGRKFTREDTERLWKTQLLPIYRKHEAPIAALTPKQRSALYRFLDDLGDHGTHFDCVIDAAVQWLDAHQPGNRGQV